MKKLLIKNNKNIKYCAINNDISQAGQDNVVKSQFDYNGICLIKDDSL